MGRRKRRAFSKERKIQAAIRRYSMPERARSFPSLQSLQHEFGRTRSTLQKGIYQAFREGWVKIVQVAPREPTFNIDNVRQVALNQRFPNTDFRVIEAVEHNTGEKDDGVRSDEIHKALGELIARDLTNSISKESGIRVGLGGGRAVFHLVEKLRSMAPLKWDSIQLVSLSGYINARHHAEVIRGHLDADTHVTLFNLYQPRFGTAQPLLTSSPIVWNDDEATEMVRELSPVSQENWPNARPDLAIVGVGVLSHGHRLAEEDNDMIGLSSVSGSFQKLRKICRKAADANPEYCPIADCCNHLFLVPPPADELDKRTISQVRKLLSEINLKMVNVNIEQLSEIDRIIVIAGTRPKARAIFELLKNTDNRNKTLNIRRLYTDTAAAREIIHLAG